MVAVAAKGLGTGEGWFERGQGAHLPARRASKDPPTVTSVGERQRRARAGRPPSSLEGDATCLETT